MEKTMYNRDEKGSRGVRVCLVSLRRVLHQAPCSNHEHPYSLNILFPYSPFH